MAIEHRCQKHGRPAVAQRIRTLPDGTQEVEYLCEIDIAEERMANRFGGRSLFDDFFSDFFDRDQTETRRPSAPDRSVERVDVTQFFSDATRELLQRAARTALEWGSLDLDTDHLLYAALQDDVVQHVLRQWRGSPRAAVVLRSGDKRRTLLGMFRRGDDHCLAVQEVPGRRTRAS